jgi:hypothetical protein
MKSMTGSTNKVILSAFTSEKFAFQPLVKELGYRTRAYTFPLERWQTIRS